MQHAFSNYFILNMCAVCAYTCMRVRTLLSFCVLVCVPVRVCVFVCVYVNFGVVVFQSTVGPCVRRKLLNTETRTL